MKFVKLNRKDIIKSYRLSKKLAKAKFQRGNFEKCLHYIELSAQIAYQFNWIYCDDDLEQLLSKISTTLIKPVKNNKPKKDRYVFYDTFSTDNRALTQQYTRALMANNCEFLYITESSKSNIQSKIIFKELGSYDKVEVFEIQQELDREDQIRMTYEKIISYCPSKLFIHIHPWSVNAITVLYALPKEITRYKINLTDHAFWLGTGCLDYSLEFRSRGCTLSHEDRGINLDKLLLLPYYPIVNDVSFEGFPAQCANDKVIVLSGGSVYKVYGKKGEYLKIVKQLLDENPKMIFLFAGAGDMTPMKNFISKNKLSDRFLMIGNRTDINEVFKHCDIYMGTYPLAGGLMTQFAAFNAKPVLAYTTPDLGGKVEGFICHYGSSSITFTDKELFFAEAGCLVKDAAYRKQRGEELRSNLITKEQFDKMLMKTINLNKNQYPIENIPTNHKARVQLNIELENEWQIDYKKLILNNYKIKTIYLFPKIFLWFIVYLFKSQDWKMIYHKLSNGYRL